MSEGARGKPVSGRTWKPTKKRTSSVIAVKSLRKSWDDKVKERREKQVLQEYQKEVRETLASERKAEHERIKLKHKQKEENEKKAQVVQRITNTAKLKRMTKKQLKRIEKR